MHKEKIIEALELKPHPEGGLLRKPASYALIGCTVAPGFEFEDFTLEIPRDLATRYSDFSGMIEILTLKK